MPPHTPSSGLGAIEVWLFDLDNTLYSSASDVFPQIHRRMIEFIVETLGVDEDEARRLRGDYFRRYGTTMKGLMVERGIDPDAFLDFVHRIDLGGLPPSPRLDAALARLPGRKLVYTNASTRHAEAVLARLGIASHFEALFDIAAADYVPKPEIDAYRRLVARHGLDPNRAAMLDDIPHNLEPAAALGMTTVWIREPADARWRDHSDSRPYIHHVAADLASWLETVPLS